MAAQWPMRGPDSRPRCAGHRSLTAAEMLADRCVFENSGALSSRSVASRRLGRVVVPVRGDVGWTIGRIIAIKKPIHSPKRRGHCFLFW